MATPEVDPEQFLEQLKERHGALNWEPLPPDDTNRSLGREQARNGTALAYLHQHYTLPDSFNPEEAGGGPKGRLVRVFGRLTFGVLGRYLREERELLAHMVRIAQTLEQRCDELTVRIAELNEEIIRRQVAESRNQAWLSAWLHAALPSATAERTATPGDAAAFADPETADPETPNVRGGRSKDGVPASATTSRGATLATDELATDGATDGPVVAVDVDTHA